LKDVINVAFMQIEKDCRYVGNSSREMWGSESSTRMKIISGVYKRSTSTIYSYLRPDKRPAGHIPIDMDS
jgi:hypothetical protein